MSKPRLLDLFAGAQGAGVGYARAGFEVHAVDIEAHDKHPEVASFTVADAMDVLADVEFCRGFDVVHASPPCQAYSAANHIHGRTDHPDLIGPVREGLLAAGRHYVIENVPGAPLANPFTLCGLAFGLNVKRHRLFECDVWMMPPPCGPHDRDYVIVFGGSPRGRVRQIGRTPKDGPILRRPTYPVDVGRKAMGIDWMTRDDLSQAIPPAYTEWIGAQLLEALERAA